MGIVQKDAIRTTVISYLGLVLGYLNKGVLFLIFLNTSQIGLLGLIVSVGVLFAQFSNLGVAYSVWRFFPFLRNLEKKHYGFFQATLYLNSIGILVFTLLAIVFKDFICSFYTAKSASFVDNYYWILPIGIAYSLFLTLDNFLRSLGKNVLSVFASELLLRIVMTICIVLFSFGWIDFFTLLVLQSISYIFPTLILFIQLTRNKESYWSVRDIVIPKRFKQIILSYSFYTYFNFIGILIVTSIDTIMVASILGLSEAGVFSTIIYIVSGLMVPNKSLIRVSAPFIAKYWKERDMQGMRDLYSRISSIGLVLGLFMFLLFWGSRNEIFAELPASFAEGVPVFLVLMIGRLVDMYCGINGSIFVSSKKYKYDLVFTVVLCTLVCTLNVYLIPVYGILGAAISTTITYVLYNLARVIFIFKAFDLHPFKMSHLFILLVFCVSCLCIEVLPSVLFLNTWVFVLSKSLVSIILFLAPIYYLNLDKDVVGYMKKILRFMKFKVS